MIKERFMVTGKRIDNGETVTGYSLAYENSVFILPDLYAIEHITSNLNLSGRFIGTFCIDSIGYKVDLETIEPVAVKPIGSYKGNLERPYNCPNCLADETVIKNYDYCPDCGQRIDWSENGE